MKILLHLFLTAVIFLAPLLPLEAQIKDPASHSAPAALNHWVDAVFDTLSPDQRIALLTDTPATNNLLNGIPPALSKPIAEELLHRKLLEASLTVLRNERVLMPLLRLDTLQIASVSFGTSRSTPFQEMIGLYTRVTHFNLPLGASQVAVDAVKEQLAHYNLVIGGLHEEPAGTQLNKVAGAGEPVQQFISLLSSSQNTIMAVFKNAEALAALPGIEQSDGLIITYHDSPLAQELAAQLIFGGISAGGRLPQHVGNNFREGEGIVVAEKIRLGYGLPEEVGMDSEILYSRVDSLVNQAMDVKATPGAQVLVARNGKVVLHKAYGYHEYSDTVRVKKSDLYDLASVTKISSGLAALMKLHDEGKFNPDAPLGQYLPSFKRSNKADIPMRDILTHQGRLTPWIPFWKNTIRKNGGYKWFTFRPDSSARYPIKIRENMYLHRNYPDRIMKAIRKSPLLEEKKYVYSDFFFILAPRVVENISGEKLPVYLQQNFYEPLGATSLTYNPYEKYPPKSIVPTEYDFFFRHEPIRGRVHDEGAIMLGGISGHAGLFSNANDLAKLLQMYLNGGSYGGRQYISTETLQEFTRYQFPENNNRRGLGFDKPALEYTGANSNTARDASKASFGHTGFTGIFVWMDPEYDLLYIFLSNRVMPTRDNNRLGKLNTRTNIQQVLYDAIRE
ncbi:beta-N-acetylglucosaminidase [Flammeovirgaceae bacterium 311]|nr:beta-N-acetylglucosaminidase [Flammeovirgaceae bacterium 311]